MKLQHAWFRSLLSATKSALRRMLSTLRMVGRWFVRGGSETLPEFVLSIGLLPSPMRDPAVAAWLELKRQRDQRRKKPQNPSEPAKVLPIHGSVDDPLFRINM